MTYSERLKDLGFKNWYYKGVSCWTMNNGYCFNEVQPTTYYKSEKELKKELDTWDTGEE